MPSPIRIATRGSALALAQANQVLKQCCDAFPEEQFELRILKTTGDKLQVASLASANLPKGLFTKELEVALLKGEADLAVHSLKDLPTELPAGLELGAVGQREDVRDVLLCRQRDFGQPICIQGLPRGATVATSSARRNAQLLDRRPDLTTVPIRGNVGTRLKKLAEQADFDATILAAAGLARLGFEIQAGGHLRGEEVPPGLLARKIDLDDMLPCVGQAAIGIEVRENDPRLKTICAKLDHEDTHRCVQAERAFLRGMGGGCQLAVAAHAEIAGTEIWMRVVSFLEGKAQRVEARRTATEAVNLGEQLAASCRS